MNKIQLYLDRTQFIPSEDLFPSHRPVKKTWKVIPAWFLHINQFNWIAIGVILVFGIILYKRYLNKKKYLKEQQDEQFFTRYSQGNLPSLVV